MVNASSGCNGHTAAVGDGLCSLYLGGPDLYTSDTGYKLVKESPERYITLD